MLGACPYSLEDGVKIVATCQIVTSFLRLVLSGFIISEFLKGTYLFPIYEPIEIIDSLFMSQIANLAIFSLVLLVNIGLFYWGAKKKKEGICWVWLGMTTATITISIVSAITKLAGVKVGLIGTYRKENGIAALIYDVGQFIAILVVFNFVKQLRHQRRAHQLELSVSVANAAGVGKKREEPLVQAAGYGHYEQPHTLPVYQPTSTISTI